MLPQGCDPAPLSSEPLDTREVFAVVNAWRCVRPGGTFRALLAFTPSQRTEYLQVSCVSFDMCGLLMGSKCSLAAHRVPAGYC